MPIALSSYIIYSENELTVQLNNKRSKDWWSLLFYL
nr:MAG TPA: hypothetical protein [Caudoviricetes sp.]